MKGQQQTVVLQNGCIVLTCNPKNTEDWAQLCGTWMDYTVTRVDVGIIDTEQELPHMYHYLTLLSECGEGGRDVYFITSISFEVAHMWSLKSQT